MGVIILLLILTLSFGLWCGSGLGKYINERNYMESLELYPGQIIELTKDMNDPYNPIPAGTRGIVLGIYENSEFSQIDINWENGSLLCLLPHVDEWKVI